MAGRLITLAAPAGEPAGELPVITRAVARLFDAGPHRLAFDASADRLLRELDHPEAVACLLPTATEDDERPWRVVARARKPVVLVSPRARMHHPTIQRALLPLDGAVESIEAVEPTTRLLHRASVELVLLHVFDEGTVPRFWDQQAHAHRAWTEEFVSRSGVPPGARVEFRRGPAGTNIVQMAEIEDADLIVLAWSRNVAAGRARTVRETVAEASVPVVLLPMVTAR